MDPIDPIGRAISEIARDSDTLRTSIARLSAILADGPQELTPDEAQRLATILSAVGMAGAVLLQVDLGRTALREDERQQPLS